MNNKDKARNNRRCIIQCCSSSSLKDKNLKFFRFPMPETQDYHIWLSACKDSYNQIRVLKKPLICSLHFVPEDVGGRRLNPGAFPRVRLTADKEMVDAQARDRKIKFMNEVMVEWLIRSRPYREIYGKLLIGKAREARDLLDIPNYIPDKSWLKSFNKDIADPESRLFRKSEPCGSSVRMPDVIREMLQLGDLREEQELEKSIEISDDDDDDDDYDDGDFSDTYADLSSKLEVSVTVDEDGDYYEPSMKMPKLQSISLDVDEDQGCESKKTIASYKEALTFMKPLEDFALLAEDFRAIGLLAQLEAIFKQHQE